MEFGFKTPLTRGPVVKSQIRHLTGELQRNHSPDISASVVVDFSEVLITGARLGSSLSAVRSQKLIRATTTTHVAH